MTALALAAGDLTTAFKRLGGYLKQRAQLRYEAQAFAPLAQSTLDKRAQHGLMTLERKLETDYRKAKKRGWDTARAKGQAPRGVIAHALTRMTLGDMVGQGVVMSSRGVQNRLKVLEEFRRRHRRGAQGGGQLTTAQTKGLNAREARAVARQVGKPILGGLTRSLVISVGSSSVTLSSRTFEKFSEVHNEGGSAGHGATIPERMTLTVEDRDLDIFADILRDEMLSPLEGT